MVSNIHHGPRLKIDRQTFYYEILSDQIHPFGPLSGHRPSRNPKVLLWSCIQWHQRWTPDLAPQPSQKILCLINLFKSVKTNSFLPSSDGNKTTAQSERLRRLIRRLLNLYHSSTLSDITAVWDLLGLTAYNTVNFSRAVFPLDNLIV